jgi:sugar (pentulose or hexulose) kinase
LTGLIGAEGTYIGCHTYLWNQLKNQLSSVVHDLGIAPLMSAKLNNSWDVLGTITADFAQKTGLPPTTIVTMGIHDSNSSLLPHFAKKGETGFVLNSTGTWCVIMNPVEKYGFAPDELGKVVFFNISAFRKPVKTAIFLGGQEFETWSKVLMTLHKRKDIPAYDKSIYIEILQDKKAFLLPELTSGSGQFPKSKPRVIEDGKEYHFDGIADGSAVPPIFRDYERAIALLKVSLVLQTLTALERTGLKAGADVFTEGGFRKDEAYNALLSSALTNTRVFLTDIAEATALGAAMTAKMALTDKSLSDLAGNFDIDYKEVSKSNIPALESYRNEWLQYTE